MKSLHKRLGHKKERKSESSQTGADSTPTETSATSSPAPQNATLPSPQDSGPTTTQTAKKLEGAKRFFPEGSTLGLNVIHEPNDVDPKNVKLDILFIHGLTGDAYETWVKKIGKSEVYWPVELLPQVEGMENARILAFGYDADFVGRKRIGQNNLHGHAMNLVGGFGRLRTDLNHSFERPIIIVAHSLGGLVAKKALALSNQAAGRHLKQLHMSTFAIAFLSTPHRGAKLAGPGQGLSEGWRGFSSSSANPDILETLKRDSQTLDDLENTFGTWIRARDPQLGIFDLVCFYEELETPPFGLIVTKESGNIAGYPGPYSIHADHSNIAKFGALSDSGFKTVSGELQRWSGSLQPVGKGMPSDEAQHKCIASLGFKGMYQRQEQLDTSAPGTCEWLFESPQYQEWRKARGLLWINGKPGSGKSTLMKALFNELVELRHRHEKSPLFSQTSPDSNLIVASFFFNGRGDTLHKSALGFLRALSCQLCEKSREFHLYFAREWEEMNARGETSESWSWTEWKLEKILKDYMGRASFTQPVWILVDAVDEIVDGNNTQSAKRIVELCQNLSNLSRRNTSTGESTPGLGVCFSSRHYPIIIQQNIRLQLRMEEQNYHDIIQYVETRFSEANLEAKVAEELCNLIETRAQGVFLWSRLVVEESLRLALERPSDTIPDLIKEKPIGLPGIYKEKLETVKSAGEYRRKLCLRLLQWLCFAARALTVEELRIALVLSGDNPPKSLEDCGKANEYVKDDDEMENLILSWSVGLAEITKHPPGYSSQDISGTVQLIHQSVKDFLMDHGLAELEGWPQTTAASWASLFLPRTCVQYVWPPTDPRGWSNRLLSEVCVRYIRFPEYLEDSWMLEDENEDNRMLEDENEDNRMLEDENEDNRMLEDENEDSWMMENQNENCMREYNRLHPLVTYVTVYWLHHVSEAEKHEMNQDFLTDLLECPTGKRHFLIWREILESLKDMELEYRIYSSRNESRELFEDIPHTESKSLVELAAKAGWWHVLRHWLDKQSMQPRSLEIPSSWLGVLCAVFANFFQWVAIYCFRRGLTRTILYDRNCQTRAAGDVLLWSTCAGRQEVVRLLLKRNDVDLNHMDENRWTALHTAIIREDLDIVSCLLEDGRVDVNAQTRKGSTSLHLVAAGFGSLEAMQLLLDRKDIDVNALNEKKQTPLHVAAARKKGEIVSLLLQQDDVRTNAQDSEGKTAFDISLFQFAKDFEKFSRMRSDPDTSIYQNSFDISKLLFQATSDLGKTQENSRQECSEKELSNIDVKMRTERVIAIGRGNMMTEAARSHNLEVLQALVEMGFNKDAGDDFSYTPLHLAVRSGNLEIVRYLVEVGADRETKNFPGLTPLHQAALPRGVKDETEIFKILIQDETPSESLRLLSLKDKYGRTPAELASLRGNSHIAEWLERRIQEIEESILDTE